jgi:glycosyltransferase involved in cell wall biosynthesis
LKQIFHVITTIKRGGAENQLLILVREQIKLGMQVHVVFLKGEPELEYEFTNMGAFVHHEVARSHLFFQTYALRKVVGKSKPIVHAHLPRAELISLFTPARFKLVTSRHNAEPFFPAAPKTISNLLSKLVEIRCFRIIAISEAVKVFLIERDEIRNIEKVEVVLYGYQPTCNSIKGNVNPSNTTHKLGTISRLTHQKDIPTLLHAFQIVHKDAPQATLNIVGSGPLESNLLEMCNRLGLKSSVNFLGRTSQIFNFLMDLDVFILTSRYEGFGMVLLEAMDAGVPIVASNNSAIPEVLGPNFPGLCETGNYQEFYNKILKLNDPDYRKQVLSLQKKRLALFEADGMAQKINKIYFD